MFASTQQSITLFCIQRVKLNKRARECALAKAIAESETTKAFYVQHTKNDYGQKHKANLADPDFVWLNII